MSPHCPPAHRALPPLNPLLSASLAQIIGIYLDEVVGEGIICTILGSTVNVRKTDLEGDGKVTEADFVLCVCSWECYRTGLP